MSAGYSVLGQNDMDNLIAGNQFPVMYKGVSLAASQGVLKRGSLLGIVTASGAAVLCKAAATDGSQTAKYILTADTDTGTSSTVAAVAYQSGVFNRSALVLAAGEVISSFEDTLRMNNIILADSFANPTV
jgi:hypothetical protein